MQSSSCLYLIQFITANISGIQLVCIPSFLIFQLRLGVISSKSAPANIRISEFTLNSVCSVARWYQCTLIEIDPHFTPIFNACCVEYRSRAFLHTVSGFKSSGQLHVFFKASAALNAFGFSAVHLKSGMNSFQWIVQWPLARYWEILTDYCRKLWQEILLYFPMLTVKAILIWTGTSGPMTFMCRTYGCQTEAVGHCLKRPLI